MKLFFIVIGFSYGLCGMDLFDEHIKKSVKKAKIDPLFIEELHEDFYVSNQEDSKGFIVYQENLKKKITLQEKIEKQKIRKRADMWQRRASALFLILGYLVISLQKGDL